MMFLATMGSGSSNFSSVCDCCRVQLQAFNHKLRLEEEEEEEMYKK